MTKLSLFFGLLATMSNVTSTTVTTQAPGTYIGPALTREEMRLVELANRERVSRGLPRLTVDERLVTAARAHSREMAEKRYFSHTSPTPTLATPADRYLSVQSRVPMWAMVGENLFYCSIIDIERGHNALMQSEPHRDNLLNDKFERIGVGTFVSPEGEFFVTQMFLAEVN